MGSRSKRVIQVIENMRPSCYTGCVVYVTVPKGGGFVPCNQDSVQTVATHWRPMPPFAPTAVRRWRRLTQIIKQHNFNHRRRLHPPRSTQPFEPARRPQATFRPLMAGRQPCKRRRLATPMPRSMPRRPRPVRLASMEAFHPLPARKISIRPHRCMCLARRPR